jgi:hypothetical protein
MRVFVMKPDPNHYGYLVPVDSNRGLDSYRQFNGSHLSGTWVPLEVQLIAQDNHRKLLFGDYPLLSLHIPVFSQRAVTVLGPCLENYGELLPLSCQDGVFYAFNVTTMLDVLDVKNCVLNLFPGTSRILDVRKYAFYAEGIVGKEIFKVPQVPLMDVFTTDSFRSRIEASNLDGFIFKQVWPESE